MVTAFTPFAPTVSLTICLQISAADAPALYYLQVEGWVMGASLTVLVGLSISNLSSNYYPTYIRIIGVRLFMHVQTRGVYPLNLRLLLFYPPHGPFPLG
jgi:hypothetical protein